MFKKNKLKKAKKELKKYIIDKQDEKSDEEIKESLLRVGWPKETIDEIFKVIEDEVEITIPIKKKKEEPIEIKEEEKPKKGLVGQIKELNEKIDLISETKKAEKKFKKKRTKLPAKVKSKLKKLAVKNKAMVLLLRGTKGIEPVIGEIKAGMLLVGDMVADAAVDGVWLWRGKYPTYILPEWDLKPLSKESINEMRQPLGANEMYKDTLENKRLSYPQQIILRAMEAKENLMLKAKTNVKGIIITIVVVIVVMGILFGGGVV